MLALVTAGFCAVLIMTAQCMAAETQGVEVGKLLAGIESKYANKGFSADFSQASRLTALDMTETAKGKAWFSHPGKMKWVYEGEDHHEIITNGQHLWIYRPEENQVMIGNAEAFFKSGSGGAFLSDIRQIRSDFTIEPGKSEANSEELILTPKKESPDLVKVYITVALPEYEIPMVVTENAYGDTTRFVFTNIRFNTPDTQLFEFTIPQGTEIIKMD